MCSHSSFHGVKALPQNDESFQHLLDQAEGATGVDPDLILDTVALCHDSHQAVLDRFSKPLTRFSGGAQWAPRRGVKVFG